MTDFYYGKACKRHPEDAGKRYTANKTCVGCGIEHSRASHAKRTMTVPQEITTLRSQLRELKAKNEQLESFKTSYMEWSDKTDWVQATAHFSELGKHRADVIKDRFDHLKDENRRLSRLLGCAQGDLRQAMQIAERLKNDADTNGSENP